MVVAPCRLDATRSSSTRSVMFNFHGRLVGRAGPLAVIALGVSLLLQSAASAAPTPVGLGTASSFGVLAGAGITNTGPTTITGDAGTFPTPSQTGFYGPAPDIVTFAGGGVDHAGDAVTQGAKSDLLTAYNDAAGRLPETSHAVELGGDTLTPGVYSNGTFGLTGTLTLDFKNDLTASFVFKTASTLITAVDSSIVIVNADANAACRITWKVGSSATFGTRTHFQGDVLVKDSITANTGATFLGRLLANDGAVTLDTNTIDRGSCPVLAAGSTPTTSPTTTSSTSPPATTSTTDTNLVTDVTASAPLTSGSSEIPTDSTTGGSGASQPGSPPAAMTPQVPELPRTGMTLWLAVLGVALVMAGTSTLAFERRRRPAPA